MSYRLGVDLGTTWTAAALTEGGRPEPVSLGERGGAMPSVVARQGDNLVAGEAAERIIAVDPGAGAREVKRRLGDAAPFVLDGVPYGAETLMGAMLAHVVAAAMAGRGGQPPGEVVLTHPANWGEFKLDLLRNAAKIARLDRVWLLSEPQAAAVSHAASGSVKEGDVIAVYDFGGGTFDAAVVRCGPDGGELIGVPEGLERLGGIDLDAAVLAHVNRSLDGQLGELDRRDPEVRAGMAALRAQAVAAKEALSSATEATIDVALGRIQTQVRLTRAELESMIRPRIADTTGALARAVRSAGVAVDSLACVLLVGGSSRIPMVSELVAEQTGRPAVAAADVKLAVASGAAMLAPKPGAGANGAVTAGGDTVVAAVVVENQGSTSGTAGDAAAGAAPAAALAGSAARGGGGGRRRGGGRRCPGRRGGWRQREHGRLRGDRAEGRAAVGERDAAGRSTRWIGAR